MERSYYKDFLLIDKFNLHSCYHQHYIKLKLEIMHYRGSFQCILKKNGQNPQCKHKKRKAKLLPMTWPCSHKKFVTGES